MSLLVFREPQMCESAQRCSAPRDCPPREETCVFGNVKETLLVKSLEVRRQDLMKMLRHLVEQSLRVEVQ